MKILTGLLLCLLSAALVAGELVYTPTHPAFGGSPLNGSWLLNEANAQNTFKDPNAPQPPRKLTELEKFNERLQASVLSRIANAVTQEIVGADGNLQPGTIETDSFSVTIVDPGDGTLVITTVDKNTGGSSTFEILNPTTVP